MIRTAIFRSLQTSFTAAARLAACFALTKLLLTFALTLYTQHLGYGYFRDEFYYIACGRHLAWGYVDHGPIVALQARLGEVLFGDSVFGIRVLSAVAGALMVLLCGLVTWALGGRRSAQALAMLGLLCAPQFIGTDGFLSMNSFEPVFWTLCVLALLMALRSEPEPETEDSAPEGSGPESPGSTRLGRMTRSPQRAAGEAFWWTIFGLSAGIGLLNKPSMLFFLLALGAGLLCTPQRGVLFSPYAAFSVALLILIALPNVLWQIHHHWPTLEFLQNGKRLGKNLITPFFPFLLTQILDLQPINALLWVAGLVALLRGASILRARWLGLTYLFFFALMFSLHAKDYYLAAIYPALFAAGGVFWERRSLQPRSLQRESAGSRRVHEGRLFAFPIFATLLILTTLLTLPMASPVLRPEAWLRYTRALHLAHPEQESLDTSLLPQFFADRFGWQQEVDLVTTAYAALPPRDRARTCIFTGNYGEAGALQLLGPLQGKPLPPVLSGHNNYWLWGMHGCTGNLVLAVLHDTPAELQTKYEHVRIVGTMNDPWAMPFEHHNIYLLESRRPSAPVHWADEKFFY